MTMKSILQSLKNIFNNVQAKSKKIQNLKCRQDIQLYSKSQKIMKAFHQVKKLFLDIPSTRIIKIWQKNIEKEFTNTDYKQRSQSINTYKDCLIQINKIKQTLFIMINDEYNEETIQQWNQFDVQKINEIKEEIRDHQIRIDIFTEKSVDRILQIILKGLQQLTKIKGNQYNMNQFYSNFIQFINFLQQQYLNLLKKQFLNRKLNQFFKIFIKDSKSYQLKKQLWLFFYNNQLLIKFWQQQTKILVTCPEDYKSFIVQYLQLQQTILNLEQQTQENILEKQMQSYLYKTKYYISVICENKIKQIEIIQKFRTMQQYIWQVQGKIIDQLDNDIINQEFNKQIILESIKIQRKVIKHIQQFNGETQKPFQNLTNFIQIVKQFYQKNKNYHEIEKLNRILSYYQKQCPQFPPINESKSVFFELKNNLKQLKAQNLTTVRRGIKQAFKLYEQKYNAYYNSFFIYHTNLNWIEKLYLLNNNKCKQLLKSIQNHSLNQHQQTLQCKSLLNLIKNQVSNQNQHSQEQIILKLNQNQQKLQLLLQLCDQLIQQIKTQKDSIKKQSSINQDIDSDKIQNTDFNQQIKNHKYIESLYLLKALIFFQFDRQDQCLFQLQEMYTHYISSFKCVYSSTSINRYSMIIDSLILRLRCQEKKNERNRSLEIFDRQIWIETFQKSLQIIRQILQLSQFLFSENIKQNYNLFFSSKIKITIISILCKYKNQLTFQDTILLYQHVSIKNFDKLSIFEAQIKYKDKQQYLLNLIKTVQESLKQRQFSYQINIIKIQLQFNRSIDNLKTWRQIKKLIQYAEKEEEFGLKFQCQELQILKKYADLATKLKQRVKKVYDQTHQSNHFIAKNQKSIISQRIQYKKKREDQIKKLVKDLSQIPNIVQYQTQQMQNKIIEQLWDRQQYLILKQKLKNSFQSNQPIINFKQFQQGKQQKYLTFNYNEGICHSYVVKITNESEKIEKIKLIAKLNLCQMLKYHIIFKVKNEFLVVHILYRLQYTNQSQILQLKNCFKTKDIKELLKSLFLTMKIMDQKNFQIQYITIDNSIRMINNHLIINPVHNLLFKNKKNLKCKQNRHFIQIVKHIIDIYNISLSKEEQINLKYMVQQIEKNQQKSIQRLINLSLNHYSLWNQEDCYWSLFNFARKMQSIFDYDHKKLHKQQKQKIMLKYQKIANDSNIFNKQIKKNIASKQFQWYKQYKPDEYILFDEMNKIFKDDTIKFPLQKFAVLMTIDNLDTYELQKKKRQAKRKWQQKCSSGNKDSIKYQVDLRQKIFYKNNSLIQLFRCFRNFVAHAQKHKMLRLSKKLLNGKQYSNKAIWKYFEAKIPELLSLTQKIDEQFQIVENS